MRRRGTWIIYLFTLLFVLLAAFLGISMSEDPSGEAELEEELPFSVEISVQEQTEAVRLWYDGNGIYYVFLPRFVTPEQVVLVPNQEYPVLLNGAAPNAEYPEPLRFGEEYALEWVDHVDHPAQERVIFLQLENIPAVYLNVQSGNMHYIHSNKENAESGSMRIYLPDGQLHYSGNLESVKGRGNATWDWEKKPYNLKLRGTADILGMGSAQKWVLLANVYDNAHIRNKVVYDTAEQLGLAYSPQSQWVDLYLNGEYAGLYLLCEKNEIHPERVAIDSVKGNLISIEKADRLWEYGQDQFVTDGAIPIRIHATTDPKKLQETVNQAERAILAADGIDPVSGLHWSELIDLESWAKKYLIEEVFGNLDAGSISQFFYWEEGGKIYAGPVWDYDVTMGNGSNWQLQNPNMLYSGRPHLWNPEDTPWFYGLYQKDAFREKVIAIYKERFRPHLEMLIADGFAGFFETIRDSAAANQLRWNGSAAQEETEAIRSYMQERMAFLDSLWLEREDYCLVQLYINWHVMACFAIAPGDTVPEQAVPAGSDTIRYEGWYDANTREPYDFSQPVAEDLLIYLKEEGMEEVDVTASGGFSGKIWLVPIMALLVLMVLIGAAEVHRTAQFYEKKKQPLAAGRKGDAK